MAASEPGADVLEAFSRAADGAPLCYVAIGGSITQESGPGWVGDWLAESFPRSVVTTVNSGIAGTNSAFAAFRLERDVIAHQPDLVLIEFCENDFTLSDAESVRYVETLVVRLKSLPRPPAIIMLEVASKEGVHLARHRRVARHYGILEVDLQAALDEHLRKTGAAWSDYFGDRVHPNKSGNAFYARVLREALAPLAARAKTDAEAALIPSRPERPSLPPPLSLKPLLLDARMRPLHGVRENTGAWRGELTGPAAGGPFIQGVLAATQPGAVLRLSFRGTAVGLYFPMGEEQGSFYVSVDGRSLPEQIFTHRLGGTKMRLFGLDLPARTHRLELALPPAGPSDPELKTHGPVRLGYLLVAGETEATAEAVEPGPFGGETLRRLRFDTLPASDWEWLAPFPIPADEAGRKPVDAARAITLPFLGEPDPMTAPRVEGRSWRRTDSAGGWVDLRAMTGVSEPGVAYARAEWVSERGGPTILSLEADYFARLWLNDARVLALEGPHPLPVSILVNMRPGVNRLVLKLGAGSAGFKFRLRAAVPSLEPSL